MVRPVCAALSNCVFSRVGILLARVPDAQTILGGASGGVKEVQQARRRVEGTGDGIGTGSARSEAGSGAEEERERRR